MRLLSVIVFCLAIAVSGASALSAAVPDAGVPIMPANEIKKGMKGYGLTVFEGTKIERFEAEILGVMYNTGAKTDLIIARLSGGPLAETGVIGGMSGSPVYIDGRLIGAIGYGWSFTKVPIALITPITEMLDTFSFEGRGAPEQPFKMEKATNSEMNGILFSEGGGRAGSLSTRSADPRATHAAAQEAALPDQANAIRRIETPLVISGIHPEVFPRISKSLEKYGFSPIQGGGAGAAIEAEQLNVKLEPGAAVGVQMVGGDISITSIGTVTWVGKGKDANAVLAFGHPMMMRGDASFPMTTAWIHTVLPNYNRSNKMGAPIAVVGAIQQDRNAAIGGRTGVHADTIPIALSFTMGERARNYRFTIIRDRLLFPELFASTVQSVLLENSAQHGVVTYGMEYALTLRDTKSGRRETIRLKDRYATYMSSNAWQVSFISVLTPIIEAVFSRRVNAAIDDIAITIKALPAISIMEITGLSADRKKARPGDTVNLTVELTPWQGQPFTEKVRVKIPEDTIDGRIILVASSTAYERYWDRFFGASKYDHYSFDSLVRALSISHDPSELAIWTELYQSGITIGDERLPNLPDSRFSMLANSGAPRMGFLNGRLRSINPTTHLLDGMQYIFLDMEYAK